MNEGLWQKWHQNVQNAPQIKLRGGGREAPAQLNWVLLRVCNERSTEDEFKNPSAVLFTKVIQNPNIIQTESWYDQTWLGNEQTRLTDSRLQHQYMTRDNSNMI